MMGSNVWKHENMSLVEMAVLADSLHKNLVSGDSRVSVWFR